MVTETSTEKDIETTTEYSISEQTDVVTQTQTDISTYTDVEPYVNFAPFCLLTAPNSCQCRTTTTDYSVSITTEYITTVRYLILRAEIILML